MITASYLALRSALIINTLSSEPLGSSGIFFMPSTGSKLPARCLGSRASVTRASSFKASSTELSIASPYSTHSMSHSYVCS